MTAQIYKNILKLGAPVVICQGLEKLNWKEHKLCDKASE